MEDRGFLGEDDGTLVINGTSGVQILHVSLQVCFVSVSVHESSSSKQQVNSFTPTLVTWNFNCESTQVAHSPHHDKQCDTCIDLQLNSYVHKFEFTFMSSQEYFPLP